MLTKLREKLSTNNNKVITSNFLALSILQGANFLLPLITFPYLVRVLGIDKFGLIMFAQAFMVYFSMFSDYGFNLSGAREISIHRGNQRRVIQIFNSIMIARFLLIIFGFVVMNIIIFSFDKFSTNWQLYYLTYGMVLGTALFPTWFFQGMEEMKYISVLTIIAKSIFTLSIFLLVQSPDDYLYVPFLNALGYISVGLVSLYVLYKNYHIQFKFQNFIYIKIQFYRGWYIFISNISINLYTTTNTFILGLFTNDTTVGYYTLAEKVLRIITSIFTPFYQAIYPHIVQLVSQSKDKARSFLQNVLKVTVVLSGVVWLFVSFFATSLFQLAFGNDVDRSVEIFHVMSPLIIVLPIAFLLFNVILLAYKMDYYFSKIYIIGGVLNLILISIFFQLIESKAISVSLALLCSEIFITFLAAWILNKYQVLRYKK